jgi:osmotically-inducible protein OsmY
MSMQDDRIEADVRLALTNDPHIPYPGEIAVNSYDGFVTLRGTVGSFGQERAAVTDTQRTAGVIDVFDELSVRLLDSDRRIDAEIRGAALQRLMSDPLLEAVYLDVRVKDGWVTLTGNVDRQSESDKAFDHMTRVRGVMGVTNQIRVEQRL